MRARSTTLLQDIGALYGGGVLGGLPDGQLLERFNATNRDADRAEAELAFATLVERHGPMVWHVCKSLVRHAHDAEDAFQATFLVLVRKAGSLRVRKTLGPWLYAVAIRTGLNSRSAAARRRAVERAAAKAVESDHQESRATGSELDDLGPLLHQEIMRLPERFRAAVVLCDLEGLSYLHAAERLNLPLGTLQSRLARARRRLRGQLTRQGAVAPPSAMGLDSAGATMTGMVARVRPPLGVVRRTWHLSEMWACDRTLFHTIVSGSIRELTRKGSRTIVLSNLNGIAAILTTAMVLSAVILFENQTSAQPRQDDPHPSPQSQAAARPRPQNPLSSQAKTLVVPGPKELKVAAGRGKILLFTLDRDGQRIPDRPDRPRNSWKEATREIRWAVVTGLVDHRAIQASFSDGGQFAPPPLEQIYKRVELERQGQQGIGAWSDWQSVDPEPTLQVLDNLPEEDPERTPDELRFAALVDPLPHLTDGFWSGVDVERLIPNLRENQADNPQPRENKGDNPLGLMRHAQRIHRPEPPVLMLRAFDFTVQSGPAYRYRSRLVFFPSRRKDPTASRRERSEIRGPWSEPTNTVTVP